MILSSFAGIVMVGFKSSFYHTVKSKEEEMSFISDHVQSTFETTSGDLSSHKLEESLKLKCK